MSQTVVVGGQEVLVVLCVVWTVKRGPRYGLAALQLALCSVQVTVCAGMTKACSSCLH